MSDPRDRDRYTSKHLTPPAGSPARASSQAERERLDRLHGGRGDDKDTPVDMQIPAEMMISRIDERTRGNSTSTIDIQTRVGKLENTVGDLKTKVEVVDSKLDLLVDESKESRRERQAREAAAVAAQVARDEREERERIREADAEGKREERAAEQKKAELAFRNQRWIDFFKIIAPIAAALAMIIAALAGAFK